MVLASAIVFIILFQCFQLPKELFAQHPSLALSLLGVTGLTAYLGVTEKGHVTPEVGQTVVISAAAGATGSVAGQVCLCSFWSLFLVDACLVRLMQLQEPQCVWLDRCVCSHPGLILVVACIVVVSVATGSVA